MGCASCGQKYRMATSRFVRRMATPTKKSGVVMKKEPVAQTIVQPQPEAAVAVPVPADNIEPATGQSVDVIKTGACPENSIAPTELPPVTVIDGHEAAESASFERKEHAQGLEGADE